MKYLQNVKILQKAVVVNSEGKILAIKRTNTAPSRPEKWDLPGGNVDDNDRSHFTSGHNIAWDAIKREIIEETTLEAEALVPVYVSAIVNTDQALVIVIGYRAKATSDSVILSSEHSEYQWLTVAEFLKLDVGEDGQFIKEIVIKSQEIVI